MPSTKWLHLWEYLSPESEELQTNSLVVLDLQDHFPSYYRAVCLMVEDVKRNPELLPDNCRTCSTYLFAYFGCWFVPFQWSYSRKGRRIWRKVFLSYVRFALMSIGIWTSVMSNQLQLVDNFREFEGNVAVTEATRRRRREAAEPAPDPPQMIANPLLVAPDAARDQTEVVGVYAESQYLPNDEYDENNEEEDDDEEGKQAEELLANYERRSTFVEYLSALTSCRSVMWQLIPGMTAFAILAVDTAACPIFIFSDELHRELTPLLMLDAWTIALEKIRRRSVDQEKKPKNWQVAACALFIFVEESRLVQFFIMIMINFVAFCIVFNSTYLRTVLKVFLAVVLFNGAVRFFFTMVPLYQFFFPAESEEDSLGQPLLSDNNGV